MRSQNRVRAVRVPATTLTPRVSLIHIIAGIGGFLYPFLNLQAVQTSFADIEHTNNNDEIANAIVASAYVLLLPMVIALYMELKEGSQRMSALAALFGVLVSVGAVGTLVAVRDNIVLEIIVSVSLALWVGLVGYMAFRYGLLSRLWAVFSMALGVLGLTAAVLRLLTNNDTSIVATFWFIYIWPLALWPVWTGVLLVMRASDKGVRRNA